MLSKWLVILFINSQSVSLYWIRGLPIGTFSPTVAITAPLYSFSISLAISSYVWFMFWKDLLFSCLSSIMLFVTTCSFTLSIPFSFFCSILSIIPLNTTSSFSCSSFVSRVKSLSIRGIFRYSMICMPLAFPKLI